MSRFSATATEHALAPSNRGRLEGPDRVGLVGVPGQGAFFLLQLKLSGQTVADARFESHGCGATVASGSMLTEWIVGKTLDECRGLTTDRLIELLEGLPPDKVHCAGQAIEALRQAVDPSSSNPQEGVAP